MNIFLGILGIILVSFIAAFVSGLIDQHRQELRDRQMRTESEQWIKKHGDLVNGR